MLKKRGRLGSLETPSEQGDDKGPRASFEKKTGQRSGLQGNRVQSVKPSGRFQWKTPRELGDKSGRGFSPKPKPKSKAKDCRLWTAASGDDPNTRHGQGTRRTPLDSKKCRRGQRGDQRVGTGAETKEKSRFEQNQWLVLTTVGFLIGGKVEESQITMASATASKSC